MVQPLIALLQFQLLGFNQGLNQGLYVTSAGNVGIGTDPGNILTVARGSATDPIADAWITYSTPESKIILGAADSETGNYLEVFKQLPVYKWKRTEAEPTRLGVVATEDVLPEILADDAKGNIQGLDLGAYIGFLHEVMKAQQKEIDQLKLVISQNSLIESIKQALSSLGLFVENGIAHLQELIAEKITFRKAEGEKIKVQELEMVDKTTGEIYCTWIENGEWTKVKGECK